MAELIFQGKDSFDNGLNRRQLFDALRLGSYQIVIVVRYVRMTLALLTAGGKWYVEKWSCDSSCACCIEQLSLDEVAGWIRVVLDANRECLLKLNKSSFTWDMGFPSVEVHNFGLVPDEVIALLVAGELVNDKNE